MKLLALDTATEACTVALSLDGAVIDRIQMGSRHAEYLLPMVHALLVEAGLRLNQLDAIAFGCGPGSFTGLRIGAGATQGLAFGADLPVIPVSSMAALAQGVNAPKVLTAFDARMKQVYWGAYQRNAQGLVMPVLPETVVDPALAPLPEGDQWVLAGSGWEAYKEVLAPRLRAHGSSALPGQVPRARDVAILGAAAFQAGNFVSAERAIPVYVRDDVAKKSGAT